VSKKPHSLEEYIKYGMTITQAKQCRRARLKLPEKGLQVKDAVEKEEFLNKEGVKDEVQI
jgi:hypothetical protein